MPDEVKLEPCPELVERVARALFDREWSASAQPLRDEVWLDDWQREYFIESAQAAIAAIEATRPTAATDDVVAAAAKLVGKLDECAPHIENLSVVDFVRSGTQYTGPSYGEALEELRTAIARTGVTLNG